MTVQWYFVTHLLDLYAQCFHNVSIGHKMFNGLRTKSSQHLDLEYWTVWEQLRQTKIVRRMKEKISLNINIVAIRKNNIFELKSNKFVKCYQNYLSLYIRVNESIRHFIFINFFFSLSLEKFLVFSINGFMIIE